MAPVLPVGGAVLPGAGVDPPKPKDGAAAGVVDDAKPKPAVEPGAGAGVVVHELPPKEVVLPPAGAGVVEVVEVAKENAAGAAEPDDDDAVDPNPPPAGPGVPPKLKDIVIST